MMTKFRTNHVGIHKSIEDNTTYTSSPTIWKHDCICNRADDLLRRETVLEVRAAEPNILSGKQQQRQQRA